MSTGTEKGIGESLPTLAESAGALAGALGIPAFVWLSAQGVEVRFASGLAEPGGNGVDTTTRVLVGPGAGKSGLQVASAGEAIGVAWQEVTASGHGVIKLRGVAQDAGLLGAEITVGGGASELSHHSLSISGYVLPSAEADGPVGAASGINLVWVASDATDAPGFGRIMMQRFAVLHSESGTPTQLIPIDAANGALQKISHHADVEAGLRGAANDNLVWVGDEDGSGGAMGRLPTVASLDTGDVLVAWIGSEGHVHGKLYGTANAAGAAAADYVAVNAALADLTPHYGRDGDGQAYDARRVKATDLGAGNFALAWMVAAGADAMLNGSVFSLQVAASLADAATADWVEAPMTPVALPASFTGEFNLSMVDGQSSDLVLSYEAADSAGNVSTTAVAQKISTADAVLDAKNTPSGAGTPDKADAGLAVNKVAFDGNSASGFVAPEPHDSVAPEPHESFAVNTHSLPPAETASAAAPPAAQAREASGLIVTANGDGLAVAWMLAGMTTDVAVLKVKIPSDTSDTEDGANTAADGWVIDVTDSADPNEAPAVVRIGHGGVVVAWVDAPSGELRTQTYSAHGRAQTSSGITVSSGHKVSDIALTSNPAAPPPAATSEAEHEAASAPDGDEFAMAWVEDADTDGYGSIMLQRYLLQPNAGDDGADQGPVGLGRDGHVGKNDAPEPFSVDTGAGPEPVVGRAPQLTGLSPGQLAMSWVENLGSQETIKGAILERDSGRAILSIDLSEQLDEPAVVAKGTHPMLSSTANGDLLVAWLEPDGNGGFDVKAALYEAAGENAWSIPDKVVELQHFASEPKDFSVGLTGDTEPAILLTWENDSNDVRGQRFDLEGNALGNRFVLRDGQAETASDTASLPDGSIVVVYAEQDKDGDVNIESHVVVTTGGDSLANTADGDASDHIFGDRGTLDTHAGLGDYGSFSQASTLDKDITVAEDATDGVIIDVLDDQADGGLRVVQINGADLAIGAPLRVEHGFVQLRGDGDLLFTADEHFHGTVNFEYTVSNEDDQLATGSVAVNVTPVEDDPMPVDLTFDQAHDTSSLSEASAAYLDHHDDDEASREDGGAKGDRDRQEDNSEKDNQHARAGDGGCDGNEARYDATDADGRQHGSLGAADSAANTPAIAAMDGATDTLAFAPRYENDGSRGSLERQWLQLAEDEASCGREGDHDGRRHDNDTFVFNMAFGNDTAVDGPALHQVIDLSKSGYPTFQALQDAGALVQVGGDVEIIVNAADPAHPEKILLRSVSLSTLTANDFKFS